MGVSDKPLTFFELCDDLLYVRAQPAKGLQRRLVVPMSLRAFVLRRHHGLPISGHPGRTKVLKRISTRFWWQGMSRDVEKWIQSCLVCRKRKTPRPLGAGVPKSVCLSPYPWHTAAIDLVTNCGETAEGNNHILTIYDTFTRWVIAIPIKSKQSHVIAEAIFKYLVCIHGCPVRIYSDQGTEFINKGLKAMCNRWSIKKIETTGWQPQANPVERVHRWINSSMTALSKSFVVDWDTYLHAVVFAYNVSESESTGYSPYFLTYGRHPRLPEDVMYGLSAGESFQDEEAYGIDCSRALAVAFERVQQMQLKMASKNLSVREAKMKDVCFEPGDYVLYWQPGHDKPSAATDTEAPLEPPAKWTYRWSGPHRIIKRLTDNHFEFVHCKTGDTIKSHVNRLCIFHPWSDDLPSTCPEIDDDTPWSMSGRAKPGDFFITPLEDCEGWPFALGRVQALRPDNTLDFVWYSNSTDNLRGVVKPGWRKPDKTIYYDDKPDGGDEPYTGDHSGTTVRHEDLVVHGFALTGTGRIPMSVLKVVSSSPKVNWSMPPKGKGASVQPPLDEMDV